MTGFEKSWLSCTQQQDTFHHHKIARHHKIAITFQAGAGAETYAGTIAVACF